jgi:hypothetical protein
VKRLNFWDAAQRFAHSGRVFAFDCDHGHGANALRFNVWFEPHSKTANYSVGGQPVDAVCSGTAARGPEHFRQHPSHAVDLVDKIENNADAFVIDAQIALQVPDQLGACNVRIRKRQLTRGLAWNEPLLLDPCLERLTL